MSELISESPLSPAPATDASVNSVDTQLSFVNSAVENNSEVSAEHPHVPININHEAASSFLADTAQENLKNLKTEFKIAYGHYLACQKVHPHAQNTKNAYISYKEAESAWREADEAYKIFKYMDSPPVMDDKKSMLVPSTLPFLQLRTDPYVHKKHMEVFDSVYDFCVQFKTVLEAHSLSMDDHWERLLPVSLSKEERSWFDEKLRNKMLNWKQAEELLLDHYDTPYRKFLLMSKVWTLKQGPNESTRVFAAKFQQLRRQATLPDGLSLVLTFWTALRENVRTTASVAVSSQYGTKLPSRIDNMVDLVVAATNDTGLFSSGEVAAPSVTAVINVLLSVVPTLLIRLTMIPRNSIKPANI